MILRRESRAQGSWALMLILLACGFLTAAPVRAEEPEAATTVRTKDGLRFKLPPDWPIENHAPISLEEYLARKFGALEKQLQGLEQQVSGMDLRVRVLEEQSKKQQQQMKSLEGVP